MNNGVIIVKHTFAEQHIHGKNQQRQNMTQNQSNSPRSDNVIDIVKNTPMNPTPLYISFSPSRS